MNYGLLIRKTNRHGCTPRPTVDPGRLSGLSGLPGCNPSTTPQNSPAWNDEVIKPRTSGCGVDGGGGDPGLFIITQK